MVQTRKSFGQWAFLDLHNVSLIVDQLLFI